MASSFPILECWGFEKRAALIILPPHCMLQTSLQTGHLSNAITLPGRKMHVKSIGIDVQLPQCVALRP